MALLLAHGRERSQNVVGLIPLFGQDGVTQIGQHLLDEGQLLDQLLRHPLALRLVAVKHLVAEGGGLQVKGAGHRVGLHIPQELEQNIHKAKDGVGVGAVLVGQQLDAVEGAVENTVGIQTKQFHANILSVSMAQKARYSWVVEPRWSFITNHSRTRSR